MFVLFVSQSREAVDPLWELVRLNRESQQCFRAAGDGVDDPELTAVFYQLARQRGAFADQLQAHLPPKLERSAAETPMRRRPALQRWWQALRQRFSADEVRYALRLAVRAEDEALSAYDSVLDTPLPPEVAQTLHAQRDEVVGAHEKLRALHQAWSLRRAS